MERAAHLPRLDQATVRQGAADVAGLRCFLANSDGQFGRRSDLRLDAAQPSDDLVGRLPADRVEHVPLHPPGKRLGPGDLRDHDRSLARPRWRSTIPALG